MPTSKQMKIKLLKLYEILNEESDEDNAFDTYTLIDKLAKADIQVTRQTLYEDIKTLNEFGYEIKIKQCQGCSNKYYIEHSKFSVSELKIMIDAVQASNIITPEKTAVLVKKLASLAGLSKRQLINENIVYYKNNKHTNDEVYNSINIIVNAINNNKQISFQYFDFGPNIGNKTQKILRKDGVEYYINPVKLVYSEDNYYLAGYNSKHLDSLSNYRIDRMTNVAMTDIDMIPVVKNDFGNNKGYVFSMFNGEKKGVEMIVHNSKIDMVIDNFGEKVSFKEIDSEHSLIHVPVEISPNFYRWCFGFSDQLKIVSPPDVVEQMKNYLTKVISLYEQ